MYSGKKGEFKVLVVLALVIVLFGFFALKEGGITGAVVGTEIGVSDLGIMAAPVAGNITINSTLGANATNENITIYWDITDSDGDDVKNITNWKLDGTSITVLNMPFEANATGTNATDYSGFGNDGTENGGVTWNSTGGYDSKGAYEFDGSNDYIDAGSSIFTENQTELTIEAWINVKRFNNRSDGSIATPIVSDWNTWAATSQKGHGLKVYYTNSTNKLAWWFNVANGSTYSTLTSTAIDYDTFTSKYVNKWWHIVGTFKANENMKLYINGKLNITKLSSVPHQMFPETNTGTWIGRTGVNSGYLNGTIDEVRIYNRSLSAEQIKTIYENRTDMMTVSETSIGDNWSACITPNDGTQDGTEVCSVDLTIKSRNLINLSDEQTLISFDLGSFGGVYTLKNNETSRDFIEKEKTVYKLYEVAYKEEVHSNNTVISNLDAETFNYSIEEETEFVRLTFRTSHLGEEINVTATITLNKTSDKTFWDINATNTGNKIIQSVKYPIFYLNSTIGNDSSDDRFLTPFHDGTLFHDFNNWSYRDMVYPHPGGNSMQFLAYYDSEYFNSSLLNGGLYFSTLDTEGYKKRFGFYRKSSNNELIVSYAQYIPEEKGNNYSQNYEMFTKFFYGDWYDAADIYRDWARNQSFANITLLKRDDIPSKIIESEHGFAVCREGIQDTYANIAQEYYDAYLSEPYALDEINNLIFYACGGWGYRNTSWSGIDYFEPLANGTIPLEPLSNDTLANASNLLTAINFSLYPFLSGLRWDIYELDENNNTWFNDTDDYNLFGYNYTIINEDGQRDTRSNLNSPTDHTRSSAMIDIGSSSNNIMDLVVLNNVRRLILRNITMTSLDQIVGGEISGCWDNDTHNHPVGEGKWTHDRFVELLQNISQVVAELNKTGEFVFSMEHQNELYLPYLTLNYGRVGSLLNFDSLGNERIPLFLYVYKPYYIEYERGDYANNNSLVSRWSMGKSHLSGNIPGFILADAPEFNYSDQNSSLMEFDKKLTKLVGSRFRYSDMLHPPDFEGIPLISYYSVSYGRNFYLNPVVTNMFLTQNNNSVNYLFVNINESHNYTVSFNISDDYYPFERGLSYDIVKYVDGAVNETHTEQTLPFLAEFNISSEEFIEYNVTAYTALVTTESPGGGGSSSGISLVCQIGTIKCISSLQYQECLEYGTTNKWGEVKDVKEGFQCQFGKIVEIEEVTNVVEEKEETQPTHPEPAEEPAEERTALTGSAWMQSKEILLDLTWLWATLLIIIISGIVVYWLKRN